MKKIILLLLLLAAPLHAANETVYVVPGTCTNGITTYNPAGAGSCTGGSAKVFSSLANGWAGISGSNNKIWVRAGTYTQHMDQSSGFVWKPGVSWANFNSMENYNSEVVTVRPSTGNFVVYIQDTANKYIELKGLVLDSVNLTTTINPAVKVSRPSAGNAASFIRFQSCDIKNARGNCVLATQGSNSLEFIGNDIHNCGHILDSGLYSYGLYLSSANNLLSGNNIYHNGGMGIQIYDGASGGDPSSQTIRGNNIYDNDVDGAAQGRGAAIVVAGGSNHLVYNNLMWDNYRGVFISFSNSGRYANNTIYSNTAAAFEIGTNSGNIFQNNIIYQNGSQINNGSSAATFTANVCGSSGIGCDPTLVMSTSPFVSAPTDFHLNTTNNHAIDSGVNLSTIFTTDYAGTTRQTPPAAWDAGAYRASVLTDSLTLLSPSGPGISVTKNTNYTVTWSSTGTPGDVTIKLGTDGTTWPTPLATGITNDLSESVTMPNVATATTYIQICNAGATICDVSDNPFAVTDAAGGTITKIISDNTGGVKVGDIPGISDVYITQGQPTTNKDSAYLYVSKYAAGFYDHSLISFDGLSQIPTTATISSVTIGLYMSDGGGGTHTVDIRRLLRVPVEASANWNTYDGTNGWTTAGATGAATDRVSATSAQMTGISVTPGYFTVTSTSGTAGTLLDDVRKRVNGTYSSLWWHLENGTVPADVSQYRRFDATESSNAAQRPYLELTYTTSTGTITLTSPSSGTHLFPGQTVPIRWQSQGVSGNVQILVSRDGGSDYEEIQATWPYSQPDFSWTVSEGKATSNALFKVVSVNDPNVFAVSSPVRIGGKYRH